MNQTSNTYDVLDNKIIFQNGEEVTFDYPIGETLDFKDAIVLRLKLPSGVIFNENVFGLSHNGKILWQISKQKHIDDDSPYTQLSYQNNKAGLYNWDASLYIIEPTTGKVIEERFLK
ncbi:MAG: hypothetical protein M3525_13755 [Acidobacteriota bacterium]|jgi:hypothetical protein|nr:hypothetical protein [Acidobacteriota bacterium]